MSEHELVRAYLSGRLSRRAFLRRAAAAGLSVPAVSALLAACGSNNNKNANTGNAKATNAGASNAATVAGGTATAGQRFKGTVQILVGFGTGNAPAQIPVQQELAEAYMKQQPDVKIEFVRVPDSTAAQQKLTVATAGGQPPDVVLPAGRYGVYLFVDQGIWQDLGPRLAQSGVNLDVYPSNVLEAIRATGYYPQNSKAAIGVPAGYHVHVMAYNKDLFAKANVPEPPHKWDTPDWTYEKQLEYARRLTLDKNGRSAADPGFDPNSIVQWGMGHFFPEMFWHGYGGRHYDPATRKAQFDTQESIGGLQWASDLVNKHHVLLTDVLAKSQGGGEGGQVFLWTSGKVAMIDMCTCDFASFGQAKDFKWDIAAMPKGPKRTFAFLNVDVGAIPRASKQQDLAWDVLRFFLIQQPNASHLILDSYGAIPPEKGQESKFAESIKGKYPNLDVQVILDAIQYCSGANEDWIPNYAQVNQLTGKHFDVIMLGQAPAESEMRKLQSEAQAAIDDWFKNNKLPTA
jgi:multiple sugar transport system substrate-binding protein